MKRQHQVELIAATLILSWLAMQAVHEFGHVSAVLLTGGEVAEVVLYPTTISYTRLKANPHPLLVACMGPIGGVALPLIALLFTRWARLRGWFVLQFFVGFCLVANGAYLGFGSFARIGDAGDILRYDSSIWLLWLFGIVTIPLGLWLWDGLGPHFGLSPNAGQVDRATAHFMFACVVIILALELTLSSPPAH